MMAEPAVRHRCAGCGAEYESAAALLAAECCALRAHVRVTLSNAVPMTTCPDCQGSGSIGAATPVLPDVPDVTAWGGGYRRMVTVWCLTCGGRGEVPAADN